ncbi:hypothetical protein LX64_00300 [Chitinophaga skermanii]|uniref:Uncharacterized protein n=1 Tax=Chitinophaga skermanii TaxID=331697 RepID=A0A327R4K3_9BACT|nr:hypothetical protein [Chitinophaga skermanii]RAJ10694.1 hypothetical protein LX64_00300 [Chitinophaga skermanii]
MHTFHTVNIVIHVVSGTLCLLIGSIAIFLRNNRPAHRNIGWLYTWLMVVVITTALLGVFVFKVNSLLLVVTLLAAYNTFSGLRAIRLKGARPKVLDFIVASLVLSSAVFYVYYIKSIAVFWSPSVVFATVGSVAMNTSYDFGKYFMSARWLQRTFLYEHVYKMVSSLSASFAAFSGTVFYMYHPYSQLLPSILGFTVIMIIFKQIAQQRGKRTAKQLQKVG